MNEKQVCLLSQQNAQTFSRLKDMLDFSEDLKGIQLKTAALIRELSSIKDKTIDRRDKAAFRTLVAYKKHRHKIEEIKDFIGKISDFVRRTSEKFDGKNVEKLRENLGAESSFLWKTVEKYERNMVESVEKGEPHMSYVLRRFREIKKEDIIYMKKTSLLFAVDEPIILKGLQLCNFYSETKEANTHILMKVKVINSLNEILVNEEYQMNIEKDSCSVTEDFLFNSTIQIEQESWHLFSIETTSKDSNYYHRRWMGNIGNMERNNLQYISSNSTKVQFLFKKVEGTGIESDVNEFDLGIVAGIIYCKK